MSRGVLFLWQNDMGKLNAGLTAFLAKRRSNSSTSASVPMIPLHPQMIASIKKSPKGQIPPGLAKYLSKKGTKAKGKKKYNFAKAEKKLGVV